MKTEKSLLLSLLLFVFLFPNSSFAQTGNNVGFIQQENYYEEIPFELIRGLPIIKVHYKNEIRNFMFDTGAQNIFFGEINDAENQKNITVNDAHQNKSSQKIVYHQDFQLGNLSFTDQPMIVYAAKDNFLTDCFKIDGLIGSNAVRNSVVKLDYSRKILIITNDLKRLNLKDFESVKMSKNSKNTTYPYISVNYGAKRNVEINYLMDSGYTSDIDLSANASSVLEKYGGILQKQSGLGVTGLGLFGTNADENLVRVKTVPAQVGKLKIEDYFIGVSSSSHSKIGYGIMKFLNPVFDFMKGRVYLQNPDKPLKQQRNATVGILFQNGKTVISTLWGDAVNKAKTGDEVLEIDGVKPQVSSICEILLNNPLSGRKTLTAKNKQGENYTVSIFQDQN